MPPAVTIIMTPPTAIVPEGDVRNSATLPPGDSGSSRLGEGVASGEGVCVAEAPGDWVGVRVGVRVGDWPVAGGVSVGLGLRGSIVPEGVPLGDARGEITTPNGSTDGVEACEEGECVSLGTPGVVVVGVSAGVEDWWLESDWIGFTGWVVAGWDVEAGTQVGARDVVDAPVGVCVAMCAPGVSVGVGPIGVGVAVCDGGSESGQVGSIGVDGDVGVAVGECVGV